MPMYEINNAISVVAFIASFARFALDIGIN